MFVDARRQPFVSEIAQDHPQFERAETAAQGDAIIHQIRHIFPGALTVAQVFRHQAESGFDYVRLARIEDAAIYRRKEPLVRVDDEAIGSLAACQHPLHGRVYGSRAAIRAIDMQPQAVAFAQLRDVWHRVDAGRRSRADGGDDRERLPALLDVLLDGLFQLRGIHAELVINSDLAQARLPNAQHHARLFDRGMRLL